ncbi:glycosyl hydrolase family 71-domain-containing protein [Naematelia encephala]|uniref:Glycosyl hydrolase family 71-domain-containing protein n=1 Tax=Naematelia encephala TaxID=71784 RepID=A0A1Y2BLK6_9TREE|nr:glycosyl hydrolase family 71-domain-containing protein [Naematelia encephala]
MIRQSTTLIYAVLSLLLLGSLIPTVEGRPHVDILTRRRHAVRSTSWTSLGCAFDSSSRAVHGYSYTNSTGMTVESCVATCDSKGYIIAGLESKTECFCGNSLVNNNGYTIATSKCNQPCPGASSETCGGSWALSLYQKPGTTVAVPSGWTSLGCSTDGSSRALKGYHSVDASYNSVTACLATCKSNGFIYAGVESGSECYCGNALVNSLGTKTSDQTKCSAQCPGNVAEKCGGTWVMNLYILSSATSTTSKAATSTTTVKAVTSTSKVASSTSKAASSTSTSKAASSTSKAASSTSKAASSTTTSKAASSTTTSKAASSTTTSKAASSTTSKAASSTSKAASTTASTTTSQSATATNCNAACTSVVGVSSPPSSSSSKTVYAHHMVGNTYSYTAATWADDISQAQAAGIDGFALNYGSDYWQVPHIQDAYAAAASAGFKTFLSLDVTSLSCGSASDASTHAGTISSVASSSAQAKYNGSVLVGTFSGDGCTFGQSSVSAGWAYLRSLLAPSNITIFLVPAIFSDPSTFTTSNNWLDGELNWNSGWPEAGSPLDTSRDTQYMSALGNKTYMPTISPDFFTYYGPNTYNKDWIYRGDDWLLARRWEQLIAMRNDFDMIELLTWNDYGESHYVGPIRTDQPNSQGWTNGMPHTSWLGLIKYYSTAFKTGKYPASSDAIYLWSRPHSASATATAPSNPKPSGWANTDDNLYAVVVLSASSSVSINAGTNTGTWTLPAGLSKISIASAPGAIGLNVTRSGKSIKSYDSTGSFSWVE